jgi:cysteine desulfurase
MLTTPLEHPSVGAVLAELQDGGCEIETVRLTKSGKVDLDNFRELLRPDTTLFTVCHTDGELGAVQPIDDIAEILRDYPDCHLHVDAAQTKNPAMPRGADTMTVAPHKFYGLAGIGILTSRRSLPEIYHEGTPSVGLIASAAAALEHCAANRDIWEERVTSLREMLLTRLIAYPKVRVNSPPDGSPYILNLSVEDVKGEVFRDKLSAYGVCVSVKSACSTPGTPSRAVLALSNRKNALSSWRIRLSHLTTEEEIFGFLHVFGNLYEELTQ